MKMNLLKKLCISTAVSLALTACGEDDGTQVVLPPDLSAVQVTQTRLEWTFTEDEVIEMDLVQAAGATSNSETPIFIRDFTFLDFEKEENGANRVNPDDGSFFPLFEGPNLPTRSVTAIDTVMTFDGTVFENSVVHPFTVSVRDDEIAEAEAFNEENAAGIADGSVAAMEVPEEIFSQGKYTFTYNIDNGANELVPIELVITVEGVEDVVEAVFTNASTMEMMDLPVGEPIQLISGFLPFNATFRKITWSSSDESIVTVTNAGEDEDAPPPGLITAQAGGVGQSAVITATSEDGLQVATTSVNVIAETTQPVLLDITRRGEIASVRTVFVGNQETISVGTALRPDNTPGDYTINWESSNPDAVFVDQEGNISGLEFEESAIIGAQVAELPNLIQIIFVGVSPPQNIFAAANGNFESGNPAPWTVHGATGRNDSHTFEVSEEWGRPDVFGNFGVRVTTDGSEIASIRTNQDQELLINTFGGGGGRFFEICYDVNYAGKDPADDTEDHRIEFLAIMNTGWADRIQNVYFAPEGWSTHCFTTPEMDWSRYVEANQPARLDIIAAKDDGLVDVRFDNIKVIQIDPPEAP